jgi:hypothetical protein
MDEVRAAIRRVSNAAFTQRYRLELMLEVADREDGIVSLTELSKALDVTTSNIQRPFEALVLTRLITPLPDSDSRYRYHIRNPSAAWDWAYELAGLDRATSEPGAWRTAASVLTF